MEYNEVMTPTEDQLTDAIYEATRRSVAELFQTHKGEHFYYCSLITTGEAHAPVLTAWSREELAKATASAGGSPDAERELKWSYADSPYYGFGEEYFEEVRKLFESLPSMDPDNSVQWTSAFTMKLRAMERAMARLNREEFFGSGSTREAIVINVEVVPPDATNTERAQRLNPPKALTAWLADAAEE